MPRLKFNFITINQPNKVFNKKNFIGLIVIFLFPFTLISQQKKPMSLEQISLKVDSVYKEANLIYSYYYPYQKVITLRNKKEDKNTISNYLVYKKSDTTFVITLNRQNQCIAEFKFIEKDSIPFSQIFAQRELNSKEVNILKIKFNILKKIESDSLIKKTTNDDNSFHYILIPLKTNKFKFYALSLTSEKNVIPFGNDYLFFADSSGEISAHFNFRPENKPIYLIENKDTLANFAITDNKMEPYIFSTDLCLYRLYKPSWWQKELQIWVDGRVVFYDAVNNKIYIK